MLKLIVFDWDGTLADSVGKIVECKQFLAGKYNLPVPTEETIKSVLGIKFADALAICFPTASFETLSELGEAFHTLMQQDSYQAKLFPNAKVVLQVLKEQGIKIAIATSKSRKELDHAISYNQLSGFFDITCCSEEYEAKPDPAMLYLIMKKFAVEPQECLMVGDTTTDIIFAKNANVKVIVVSFGAHIVSKLIPLKPYGVIDDWKQFPENINKIRDELCSQKRIYGRL